MPELSTSTWKMKLRECLWLFKDFELPLGLEQFPPSPSSPAAGVSAPSIQALCAVSWSEQGYRLNADYSHPATVAIASQCQVCSLLFAVAPSLNSILLQHSTAEREVRYRGGSPRGSAEKCGMGSFSNFNPSPHQEHQSLRSRYGPSCESTHTACHSL